MRASPKPPPQPGQRFGEWTVLERSELRASSGGMRSTYWECRCSCGAIKWVRQANLAGGLSRSCHACSWRNSNDYGPDGEKIASEHVRRLGARIVSVMRRCFDPEGAQFHNYGGRGITVHEPWVEDRSEFLRYLVTLPGWDNPKLTLDRSDNDGGYVPGNLRFVTQAEQNENRRKRREPVPVTFFYEPRVFLVGRPQIDVDAVDDLLLDEYDEGGGITADPDDDRALALSADATDAEIICEVFGRGCYGSFGERQGRVGARDYFGHILEAGHGSVLENANFSFVVTRGSRGLMAQMTRHRAGFAWAIESTHFIDYTSGARASLAGLPELSALRKHAENSVTRAVTDYAIAWAMAQDITVKKKVTAAAVRGLLPTALESKIGFTANLRALRHFCELRGTIDNVVEIRMVAAQVAKIMLVEAPALFQDFVVYDAQDGWPVVSSAHRKV